MLNTRLDFANLINERDYKICSEIGVRFGGYSEYLLDKCPNITLISIDPWSPNYPEFIDGELQTKERLKRFGSRSIVIKNSSEIVYSYYSNLIYFDFIYIDGDHSYTGCYNDITSWWNLINRGGVLAGHDYHSSQPDVIRAVDKFIKDNNLKLNVTLSATGTDQYGEEWGSNSWWIEKI